MDANTSFLSDQEILIYTNGFLKFKQLSSVNDWLREWLTEMGQPYTKLMIDSLGGSDKRRLNGVELSVMVALRGDTVPLQACLTRRLAIRSIFSTMLYDPYLPA